MSARLQVAYCSVCKAAISRLVGDAWVDNYPPRDEHEAKPDRASVRDLQDLASLQAPRR